MSIDVDLNDEEMEIIDQVWDRLGNEWRQDGFNVTMADQTTPPQRRAEQLSNRPLDHEESVVLLSSIYQARAEGRDADIPTLLNYYNDPASFRKVMWDAARRGINT